ncbi:hypothetical protein B0H66DRAFT_471452 [Apodospora peruviana]|uniref:Vacuolar protein sorting-associated protein TDA6 n=1 Tax=Apodospora peruviana TaxID=516989 RepID=A0AAE0IKM3_9PEZI|nr:hypothetical protein B0H66DRAFT_471452 [Apodospora peruviana]
MVYYIRRAVIALTFISTVVFLLWLLPQLIKPVAPDADERQRDEQWVNSSPYWVDRQACRWLGLCGIQHIKWDAPALPVDGGDNGGDLKMELMKLFAIGLSTGLRFGKEGVASWETASVDGKDKFGTTTAKIMNEVPDYVLAHAPLVHLYSGENFWPSDIAEHVQHMRPFEDGELVNVTKPVDLLNLGRLNAEKDTIFLSSADNVESRPEWLHNRVGKPVPFDDDDDEDDGEAGGDDDDQDGWRDRKRPSDGTTWWDADKEHPPNRIADPRRKTGRPRRPVEKRDGQRPIVGSFDTMNAKKEDAKKHNKSGYSDGPAVLVLVDKGAGIVDAFWFFFYSYNLGQTVLNIRFGNHVGDWEHCMVRFENGSPRAMFLSEHAGGQAYAWQALEKRLPKGGGPARPVIYSAVGSHAMYASPGMHPYVLPFKMLKDITDKGPLWDPALNNYAFWYDYEVDRDEAARDPPPLERTSLVPAAKNPDLPTSWFHFEGYWGDDTYPLSDQRQWRLFGEYHYTTGPLGPKFKNLERKHVCQMEKCRLLYSIEDGKKATWYS